MVMGSGNGEESSSNEGIFEKADRCLSELGRWYVLWRCVG